jgi:hypothetical protein
VSQKEGVIIEQLINMASLMAEKLFSIGDMHLEATPHTHLDAAQTIPKKRIS